MSEQSVGPSTRAVIVDLVEDWKIFLNTSHAREITHIQQFYVILGLQLLAFVSMVELLLSTLSPSTG